MQTPPSHVLHHQVHMIIRLKRLIDLHDVLMIHLLQKLDLPAHTSLSVRVGQLRLVIDLDRILLVVLLADGYPHDRIGALPNLLPQNEATQLRKSLI